MPSGALAKEGRLCAGLYSATVSLLAANMRKASIFPLLTLAFAPAV